MKKWIKYTTVYLCLVSLLCSMAVFAAASPVYGDADGNGKVQAEDARIALRISVGLETAGENFRQIDVDANREIGAADARLILRFAVGLEEAFPVEYYYEPPQEGEQLPVDLTAPTAALFYSMETNTVLYAKNEKEKKATASLLKLLTALTALRYCSPKDVFTVGDEIDLIAWDSSRAYIKKTWRMTLEDLLYAMLLPSGNDAAYCIAANVMHQLTGEADPATAVEAFVEKMNETAKWIGMTHTVAKSPDGYDVKGQYTTAQDLLILARAALRNDLIAEVCATPRYVFTKARNDVVWETTNHFLRPEKYYYNEHVYGLKGGFTDEAGYCLIAACEVDGQNYIAIVMGLETFGERYQCVTALMDAVAQSPDMKP